MIIIPIIVRYLSPDMTDRKLTYLLICCVNVVFCGFLSLSILCIIMKDYLPSKTIRDSKYKIGNIVYIYNYHKVIECTIVHVGTTKIWDGILYYDILLYDRFKVYTFIPENELSPIYLNVTSHFQFLNRIKSINNRKSQINKILECQ